ncbi:translocation/assembly module TamB domain-containing protein [Marinobacterium arenosum]|uniref:translocation/assembly module TamB domain-containing protein n=1 Tax=Marinobacterium arenosum TaxID=2862496 RepID=UPI001C987C64|nr:translocation/assembly module TamB domain-containing protein [Marinobacterium arenosum]MBY4677302.1 translocation/assembly module TamB [Marinobacterium arenosum]
MLIRRLLKAGGLTVLALFLLLIASLGYLLTTTQGARWTLAAAQRWLPGELEVAEIDGRLLGPLSLQQLSYRHPAVRFELARLSLDWSPAALAAGRLSIQRLQLESPHLFLPDAPDQTDSDNGAEAMQLPDLSLPLAVDLQQLQIADLLVRQGEASLLEQGELQLQLTLDRERLTIARFEAGLPQGHIQLVGSLQPQGDFPLQFETRWQLNLPEQPPLQGQGTVAGTLNRLELVQQLSGLAQAQLMAELIEPLAELRWQLSLRELQLEPGRFVEGLADAPLRANLNGSGDLQHAKLNGQLSSRLPELGATEWAFDAAVDTERLQLAQLQLHLPDTGSTLRVQGSVEQPLESAHLDLTGQWLALAYPFSGPADYRSRQGRFRLRGPLADYRLSADADLSGRQLPALRLALQAQGSLEGFRQAELVAQGLDGQLTAKGQLRWLPQLNWQLAFSGEGLNPAELLPQWSGALALQATSRGGIDAGRFGFDLRLSSLSGQLNDLPLAGHADLALSDGRWLVRQLELRALGASLTASGELAEQLALQWRLSAPQLGRILPSATGQLTADGQLRGTPGQPHLRARLDADRLRWQAYALQQLSADIQLDLSGAKRSELQLDGRALELAGLRWDRVELQGTGTPAQHRLALSLSGEALPVKLALSGGWGASGGQTPAWQGEIGQFELRPANLGHWQLREASALLLAADRARLAPLCLHRPAADGELCVRGRWQGADRLAAALELQQLPLALAEPWLPADSRLQGALSGRAELQLGSGAPQLRADFRLPGGRLELADQPLALELRQLTLNADSADDRLDSRLSLELAQPPGQLSGELAVAGLSGPQRLTGQLQAELPELAFVSLFVPELQMVEGRLQGDLRLSGQLRQPQLSGRLQLSEGAAEVPALGLRLQQIEMALKELPDQQMQLIGTLNSGEGRLALDGRFEPLARRGEIRLKGERVQAVATEQVQAWISPDLQLEVSPQLARLTGEVRVPEAHIKPPRISSAQRVSPDVVVIRDGGEQTRASGGGPEIAADLRLVLGDKVWVEAFGFNGRLEGNLRLEEDARRATRASGVVQVAAGQYRIYGQDLAIERGSLLYSGGPVDNPGLDLRVSRKVDQVTAGARVGGTLRTPTLQLFSDPAMPESSQLSYLVFGRPPGGAGSDTNEQQLLLKAASALVLKGSGDITDSLADTFQLDELSLDSAGDAGSTSLFIGKYLSPRLYVKYGVGLLEPASTFIMRYQLSKRWSLESQASSEGSGTDLIFTLER